MSDYIVTSKGKYEHRQSDKLISVENYLYIKEDGKNYLLLKCLNTRAEEISEVGFLLTQYNAQGKKIETRFIECKNLHGKANSSFVLGEKAEVSKNCIDFKVKVLSIRCGNFIYTENNGKIETDYVTEIDSTNFDLQAAKNKLGDTNVAVFERSLRAPVIISIFVGVLLLFMLLFTYLQVAGFKSGAVSFLDSGIEYEFEDGDKSEDSNIIVTGYFGKHKSVVIPEKIQNHTVIGIHGSAFSGNRDIWSLTVEGAADIGEKAFYGCSNLRTLQIDNVTSIGRSAFANCGKLTEVSAGNLGRISASAFEGCKSLTKVSIANGQKSLRIGSRAFCSCAKLGEVEIDQYINYASDISFFAGDYSLTKLKLKNFNCSGGEYTTVTGKRIAELFGADAETDKISLQELDIEMLGRAPLSFCSGLGLEKVKIGGIDDGAIGERAFFGCEKLAEISLPEDIKELGNFSFSGTAITGFAGKELEYIHDSAFAGCRNLETVALEENVSLKTIGQNAFNGCVALKSVYVPKSVYSINSACFGGCAALEKVSFAEDGETAFIGEGAFSECAALSQIALPDRVSMISGSAFAGCSALTELTLPANLREIGERAFYGCSALKDLTLPDNLAQIKQFAFAQCGGIESVAFNGALTEIGEGAFADCVNIISLELPVSLLSIGGGAFAGCAALESFSTPFVGRTRNADAYLAYMFGFEDATNAVSVPASLKTVNVTDAERIADGAFSGLYNIKRVTLPDGVQSVGFAAFEGCDRLAELTLPFVGGGRDNNGFFGYIFGANNYYTVNPAPASLKKVTLTAAEIIPEYAFYSCGYLEEIIIPEGLRRIGNNAFYGCKRLKSVTIPSTLMLMGSDAFAECYKLYEVWNLSRLNLNGSFACAFSVHRSRDEAPMPRFYQDGYTFAHANGAYYLIEYPAGEANLSLPSSFEADGKTIESYRIAAHLFREDSSPVSVNIPSSVTQIGAHAFDTCTGIKAVTLENSSVGEVAEGLFRGCAALSDIALPDGVTSIRENAFAGCSSLRSISLPVSLTAIADKAFENCYKLRVVFDYSGLNIACDSAAYGGVAQYAFKVITSKSNAEKLAFVTISGIELVNYDGEWTVIGCDSSLGVIDFNGLEYNSQRLTGLDIAPYAFMNNENIISLNAGGAVKKLGKNAFAGCIKLASVEFGDGALTEIPEYAFASCTGLAACEIPSSVTYIAAGAFENCSSLQRVVLPADVGGVGDRAFYGCRSLAVVYNLSRLAVTEKSSAHGYVAYYAVKVLTSQSEDCRLAVNGDFKFIYYDNGWFLYKYAGANADLLALPAPFEYDGGSVTEYRIRNEAFEDVYINSLIIPACVSGMEKDALTNCGNLNAVYYAGTAEKWREVRPVSLPQNLKIYYYSDCVHGDDEWTYGADGGVTTAKTAYTWTTVRNATCTQAGEAQGTCPVCGRTETQSVPQLPHSYGGDGYCTVCGAER